MTPSLILLLMLSIHHVGDTGMALRLWGAALGKGAEGPGGQQAEHEPAVNPGSRDGEQHPWQCKQEHRKQIKESDVCPLLSTH